jgi:hypothetical protein
LEHTCRKPLRIDVHPQRIVREIVSLHDGRIEARSDGLGLGSEFIVTLPPAPGPALQPDSR